MVDPAVDCEMETVIRGSTVSVREGPILSEIAGVGANDPVCEFYTEHPYPPPRLKTWTVLETIGETRIDIWPSPICSGPTKHTARTCTFSSPDAERAVEMETASQRPL